MGSRSHRQQKSEAAEVRGSRSQGQQKSGAAEVRGRRSQRQKKSEAAEGLKLVHCPKLQKAALISDSEVFKKKK